ncbi:DUF2871 domain-containing protein [Brevibacterium picturae]|uniref:DUF2871 domain-containing protein n=1 Tax=Brevibacterium picturae TaxID=260553 RepID=A0ABP4N8J9_9MICO
MKKIFNAAFAYMIIGVLAGLFYREFTKANDFPEGGATQLSVVHTHLLTLGFIVLLIVLVLDKVFGLSGTKLFTWFFWTYNVGIILTTGMMVWHGSLTVLGQESNAMIAGIAGLGHIALSVGMVLLFLSLRKAIVADKAVTETSARSIVG